MTEETAKDHPLKFLNTIDLTQLGSTALTLLVAGGLYANATAQIGQNAKDISRVETDGKLQITHAETNLVDRINSQRVFADAAAIRTSEDIREIKALLVRMDEKLDRKADKPGGR